ncbi:tRNA-guanine transglycosylase DpdA [Ammonifex thiophilus]|uniref:tRNA-guanine(15) transglycosylase-like domain-containing protein n=1 Tax=Ammonifex thiophilus TaxID=444093 RepID=A0A3D8P144_9THEO|nr:tRNA-guanine transglycosylase DpdA [Ammonifex thiophilus]RDV81175.1 hypothetical protein DXX99_09800 [Ammonifex thiophilus]
MKTGDLLIVSCSALKNDAPGEIPALVRYDGPAYRVIRSFLREWSWPSNLRVGVFSAEYGLIGGLAPIPFYERRMTPERARELRQMVVATLKEWSTLCSSLAIVCGKDYLEPLLDGVHGTGFEHVEVAAGPIGKKLQYLSQFLRKRKDKRKRTEPDINYDRLLYFLPDWDDMLDPEYDFDNDTFSQVRRDERREVHVTVLMRPRKVCDGILVSLAQQFKGKGALKGFSRADVRTLAPQPLRARFGLSEDQFLFGDCGAFSYIQEPEPVITVEQAVSLYELHGFDLGASVDHIPAPFFPPEERERRVRLTREKARAFIEAHRRLSCRFVPVGVIQGTTPESYALQLPEYVEMGYRHVGIGGLVFRTDSEIEEIVKGICEVRKKLGKPVWIHLFGIFRPKLQSKFRELGVSSFDSASYFRKAWLRSDQNYLGVDRKWYAAIRVPVSSDPRTRKKLHGSGIPFEEVERLERRALQALHLYGAGKLSLEETLEAVLAYDRLVDRNEKKKKDLAQAYKETLAARPWEKCNCPVCSELGIDVVIFRGSNRNKRRGIHNTMLLFEIVRRGFD